MIADNRQFIERFKGTYSKDQPGKFAWRCWKLDIIEIDE
jgi:hypothetical protein